MKSKPSVILLVEDNEDHAELVIRNLEEDAVNNVIHHVSDGEEALDYLFHRGVFLDEEAAPRPQLILLDLRLPKIDGLGVLKEIKASEELKKIPTVVLTSSKSPGDISAAYSHFANSFLVKPMEYNKYANLMRELGTYWLERNMHPCC